MPEFTVADSLAFDALMARASEWERVAVERKIAHEINENEDAKSARMRDDRVEDLEGDLEAAENERARLEKEVEDLEEEVENLEEEARGREIAHERELQEAEVRGYERGREEKNAA